MTVFNFSTTNILRESFFNLAIFICQLFSDGRFQSGHILYDPKIFNNRLITEIQLTCPQSIPWQITDITRPFSQSWQPNQDTDRILQLIFFNSANVPQDIDDISGIYTFYRVFIFFTVNRANLRDQITILNDSIIVQNDNFPIVGYNSLNGLMWIQRSLDDPSAVEEVEIGLKDNNRFIQVNNSLFDFDFDEIRKKWIIMIKYGVGMPCHFCKENHMYEIWNANQLFAKFFISNLNGSYINRTIYYFENSTTIWEHEIIHHKKRTIYEELCAGQNQVEIDGL